MSVDAPTVPPAAPPAHKGYGGGRPGWALVRTAKDLYEAHMIRGVLESNEIGPVVIEAVQLIGSWMLPSGHERVPQRVLVPAAVLDAAQLALMEAGLEAEDDEGVMVQAEPPQRERAGRTVRWVLAIAFGSAVVVYLIRLLSGTAGVP